MRFPLLLRTLTKTFFVTLLWLVTASNVDAAPSPRHSSAAALCDAHPTGALKKLLRRAKSYGGPLAAKRRLWRFGFHFDPTPHFERARRSDNGDDAAAIQDDAPAARISAHDGTLSSLRPIGFLVGQVDSHSLSFSFSPRSPRGPPPAS
jgi:hypothetical protein